jgi:predicted transcriptional regulator of viral defense system
MPHFMNRLIESVIEAGLADRSLTETQIARLLGGSDDRRYSIVKRALRTGGLVRIRRGRYVIAAKYRSHPPHPFALAQAIVPGSYFSMESALAWHGWIPEAVFSILSVTPGRKRLALDHALFGQFSFVPLAIQQFGFLQGVERSIIDEQAMLIATPLRALLDLVAVRKMRWVGLQAVSEGLRIDLELLNETPSQDFKALGAVYKHKTAQSFLSELGRAVGGFSLSKGSITLQD